MIKVIKPGKTRRVTCKSCEAELSFSESDILLHHGHYAEEKSFYKYIKCPCCGNEIILEE